jgi:hypothetical protein
MPLNFYAPILGPGRSAWIAEAGFGHPVSMADGMGASCDKPGGWPQGSNVGLDVQLSWSINQRN